MPRFSCRSALLRALLVAALAAIAAPLAGCHEFGDVTGSIPGSTATQTDDSKLRAYAAEAGKRLGDVSPFDLERYKKGRVDAGVRVMVNRELACLRALYNRCAAV